MNHISVFDMFKIGIGPSSSHTLGPWKATQRWLSELQEKQTLPLIQSIKVYLYGSLSLTGKGHGTDMAIALALLGELPEEIDVNNIGNLINQLKKEKKIDLAENIIEFDIEKDIVFLKDFLPFHSNGLRFVATLHNEEQIESIFYSIGGGFVIKEEDASQNSQFSDEEKIPYQVHSATDLLSHCVARNFQICELSKKNELHKYSEDEISKMLLNIWSIMEESIYLGCHAEGFLPGGLNVKRRAFDLNKDLLFDSKYHSQSEWRDCIAKQDPDNREIFLWVSLFALAVNEVNAALGRIITSPTNGSSGVIPAVLMYYLFFIKKEYCQETIKKFLLTAGIIGSLFKRNATISAAAGGCQAEIGVSSSMAAASLAEALGGSPAHCIMAAEIAMEHHLGLTCDPVGGLVQIPCIERNSMGAIKAILAAELALKTDPSNAIISFDNVVKTMLETANDMNSKYKETSQGGLALRVSVNCTDC